MELYKYLVYSSNKDKYKNTNNDKNKFLDDYDVYDEDEDWDDEEFE